MGSFYAVSTILDFFSDALHYSTSESGLFGLLLVAVGMAGAIVCGLVAGASKPLSRSRGLTLGSRPDPVVSSSGARDVVRVGGGHGVGVSGRAARQQRNAVCRRIGAMIASAVSLCLSF
jgi:hypothetical protein